MRVLHTSDWHLGRTLHGRRRHREFAAFLEWLGGTLVEQGVDALVVAGDVFDTTTPGNRAQELYYRFLCRVAASPCRHVVVVAGNHDSPTFLDAPRELLRALDVHVVGTAAADPGDEVRVLRDPAGAPELIVCAVPYLRDRDLRTAEAGESGADKERKLVAGIRDHYAAVAAAAEARRAEAGTAVPVLATGHLFTTGGRTQEDDGVRDLYVGSLARVGLEAFPETFDYLALGHLHVPQTVAGAERVRYSGSPLAMGFGEAGQRKEVCLVDLAPGAAAVHTLEVPVFQELARVRGDWEAIAGRIRALAAEGSEAWLEVTYDGEAVIGDLRERLDEALAGTRLEVLRVRNQRVVDQVLSAAPGRETLDDLDLHQVFERCLEAHQVPADQRPALRETYREALAARNEEDPHDH